MSDQLAAVARLEILVFISGIAAVIFYKGVVRGPGLASLLGGTVGGPIHAERLVLLLATLVGAAHYLSQIVHVGGASLPEAPAALVALLGASNGVYLGAKQFRQTPAGGGEVPPR